MVTCSRMHTYPTCAPPLVFYTVKEEGVGNQIVSNCLAGLCGLYKCQFVISVVCVVSKLR
jgi:hypothetical protein